MKKFKFKIHGTIKGGKNHIGITRAGRRYPLKAWAQWRDNVVGGIRELLEPSWIPFKGQVTMKVQYIPYDLKRRDLPAMQDSIFHCLERAGVVLDDAQIIGIQWETMPKDKENAGASVFLEELASPPM